MTTKTDEQERVAFEAWARKHGQPVFMDDDEPGFYEYSNVQDNWEGWKARAALQSPEVQELLDALQEVIDAADGDGWNVLDPSFEKQRAALATMGK